MRRVLEVVPGTEAARLRRQRELAAEGWEVEWWDGVARLGGEERWVVPGRRDCSRRFVGLEWDAVEGLENCDDTKDAEHLRLMVRRG